MKNNKIFILFSILGIILNVTIIFNELSNLTQPLIVSSFWEFVLLVLLIFFILIPIFICYNKTNNENLSLLKNIGTIASLCLNYYLVYEFISHSIELPIYIYVTLTLLILTSVPIFSLLINQEQTDTEKANA